MDMSGLISILGCGISPINSSQEKPQLMRDILIGVLINAGGIDDE